MRNLSTFVFLIPCLCLIVTGNAGCTYSKKTEALVLETVDFNLHVRPILSDRCFACHGPDANTREAGLRLDTEEGAKAALDSLGERFTIIEGDAVNSELVKRIFHTDEEEVMPPPTSNLTLTDNEKEILKRWVEQGAAWKDHWSFIPPEPVEPPVLSEAGWPKNEIDAFVLARMQQEGFSPEPEDTPEKWLRRVSFDLTGLPPLPEDLERFLSNLSEETYAREVDRLLAQPAYGERMATKWLDLARYADSHGYQDDRPRTMWPWRDWVVDAYNSNMPYDEFLTLQLAGDLLPDAGYAQRLATGFNRNHGITQEGGVVNEEYVTEYVADRTNTMGAAMLGLTMECARCHDHKYDPISQKEYFQMFAFFNGIDERGQINYFDLAPVPNMLVEDPELEARRDSLAARTDRAETRLLGLKNERPQGFDAWFAAQTPFVPDELPAEERLATLDLDVLEENTTPNQDRSDLPARINTRLLGVLDPPALVEGHTGNAFRFDGANYLNVGDVGDFEFSDRFTLSAWIWHEGQREKDEAVLVRRNEEQKRGGYQLLITPENRFKAGLIHDQNKERIEIQSTLPLATESWLHIAMTNDGSGTAEGVKLYVNGAEQRTEVLSDNLARRSILNGNDLLVGNWNTRNINRAQIGGFASGAIDRVQIFGKTLTALEVNHLAGNTPLSDEDPFLEYYRHRKDPLFQEARAILDSLRGIVIDIPHVMIMEEMETPRVTRVLARGAYDAPQDTVGPGTPEAVLSFPDDLPRNRLGLAQWVTHPQNPLTARVAVNRYWQMLFGRGLVATPEDFGSQGALPSHPELLDWLAVRFMASGWDTQALLKDIVLSATYRQSPIVTKTKRDQDPDNVLLARGPATRLEAEMLRDNALYISNLLHEEVGGHWVKPYQPAGVWKELANQIGENKYRPDTGQALYRRSLYSYWKRTIPPPAMLTFDAAERTVCVVKRQATSTPLQSLILLNDPTYVEAARVMATDLLGQYGGDHESAIAESFRRATSRYPTGPELDTLLGMFDEERTRYESDLEGALNLVSVGETPMPTTVDPGLLAAMTVVTNTIMNLEEAKHKS